MKRKLRSMGFCIIAGLITSLTLGIASCSPTTTGPTLKSIQISPNPSPNLSVGLSQYFYAIGLYSDGSSQDIGNQVNWVSSNISVATINSSGSVKAVAVGTSDITATFSGITSPPVSLAVVPATSTKTVTPIIPP